MKIFNIDLRLKVLHSYMLNCVCLPVGTVKEDRVMFMICLRWKKIPWNIMFDKENIKYTVSRHWNPKSRFLNNKDIYPINYAILYRIFFLLYLWASTMKIQFIMKTHFKNKITKWQPYLSLRNWILSDLVADNLVSRILIVKMSSWLINFKFFSLDNKIQSDLSADFASFWISNTEMYQTQLLIIKLLKFYKFNFITLGFWYDYS